MPNPASTRRAVRGLTLVEMLVVVAVLAVLAGVALPGWSEARERRHLEGVAAQLETDIHFGRSAAVARNEVLRLSFGAAPAGRCYVVHSGPAGACACGADGDAACTGGAEPVRVVHLAPALPVRLQANAASIAFDPVKGTVTPTATVRVVADGGRAIHQVVNVMGRVRSCSPAPALPGYRAC
ncbi:MAG: GspH/FimT family pseudopilin [Rubrivivax sp.]|jgi:type IV fimbrial biogenesis protein FimT|nr:GspH/FimT family pseudopilin [Rubrivivax sp.]